MIVECGSTVSILVYLSMAGVTAPVASTGQDEAAQQAFRAGVDAAHQERWVEARTQFERAYSLSPRPVVLINLAGAQARTGRLTEAARTYHRILDDQTSADTASFRRAAAEVLPALEARIPRIRLRPSGLSADDVIRIDGDAVDVADASNGYFLDPGEHTLVVQHAGVERARVLFTLAEQELRFITLPLPALSSPPPPVVVGVPALPGGDQAPPARVESSSRRSWWASPWTWTMAAVVVAGASLTTFLILDQRGQLFSGNVPPGQISVR